MCIVSISPGATFPVLILYFPVHIVKWIASPSKVKSQDIICGQYVNAKPVFLQSEGLPTILSNPDVRIARIQHFAHFI